MGRGASGTVGDFGDGVVVKQPDPLLRASVSDRGGNRRKVLRRERPRWMNRSKRKTRRKPQGLSS